MFSGVKSERSFELIFLAKSVFTNFSEIKTYAIAEAIIPSVPNSQNIHSSELVAVKDNLGSI